MISRTEASWLSCVFVSVDLRSLKVANQEVNSVKRD